MYITFRLKKNENSILIAQKNVTDNFTYKDFITKVGWKYDNEEFNALKKIQKRNHNKKIHKRQKTKQQQKMAINGEGKHFSGSRILEDALRMK